MNQRDKDRLRDYRRILELTDILEVEEFIDLLGLQGKVEAIAEEVSELETEWYDEIMSREPASV